MHNNTGTGKAGVNGPRERNCKGQDMARIFMTHKVGDYDEWKKGYDADAERRQAAGLREAGHFHSTDDRNSFLIAWETEVSVEEATAMTTGMLNDPELAKVMEQAGVLEKPSFWVA